MSRYCGTFARRRRWVTHSSPRRTPEDTMSADQFAIARRQFLQTTAGAALAVAAPAAAAEPSAGAWFDRPMRWAQLVLVENDPGTFDLNFWLDYFRRVHADAACLSAGGVVAYYPTDVPLHHRSAWLGTSDPFGELVKGCRAMGMAVIARTDPHATRDDMAKAHPDWIARARC